MRSTFAGLNTMVRGIHVNQLHLDTVGHNVTNANTQGYSRQRVNSAATRSDTVAGYYGSNQIGTGADALSVVRARDVFADRQFWKDQSSSEEAVAKQYTYNKIESIFSDNNEVGLNHLLNKFWQAWKGLDGDQAGNQANRVSVRDAGKNLAENISKDASDLQKLLEDNNNKLVLDVGSANQIIKNVYDLNKAIFQTESVGGMANDLRDQRDAAIDDLSSLINVNVTEDSDGFFNVSVNGTTLVERGGYSELDTITTPNRDYGTSDVTVIMKHSGAKLDLTGGSLKGVQDSVKITKEYIDDLAKMSAFLLTDFNQQHRAGFGMNDETGINFFGSDGTPNAAGAYPGVTYTYEAATGQLRVNEAGQPPVYLTKVEMIKALTVNDRFDDKGENGGVAGTDLIGAKRTAGEDTASGNNAYILGDLLKLRPGTNASVQPPNVQTTMFGGSSIMDYYIGFKTSLGDDAKAVNDAVTKYEDTLVQVEKWRGNVSGVNWQEELTDMIRYQQGFSSCSRLLTTMDEMLDKLINSTGVVGR